MFEAHKELVWGLNLNIPIEGVICFWVEFPHHYCIVVSLENLPYKWVLSDHIYYGFTLGSEIHCSTVSPL